MFVGCLLDWCNCGLSFRMSLWAVCWIGVIAGFLFVCDVSWTILGLRRMHTRTHSWTILGLSLRRMHTWTHYSWTILGLDTLSDNFGPQTDKTHTHTTHSYSLSLLILAKHCQRSFWCLTTNAPSQSTDRVSTLAFELTQQVSATFFRSLTIARIFRNTAKISLSSEAAV